MSSENLKKHLKEISVDATASLLGMSPEKIIRSISEQHMSSPE